MPPARYRPLPVPSPLVPGGPLLKNSEPRALLSAAGRKVRWLDTLAAAVAGRCMGGRPAADKRPESLPPRLPASGSSTWEP